jgi:uncharacterized membrane protein
MDFLPMHAWHPLMVHFPLGLLLGGTAAEAAGWLTGRAALRRTGFILLVSGVLLALPTIATGLLAYQRVEHSDAAHALMKLHRNLMLVAVGLFTIAVIWRWRRGERVLESVAGAFLYATLLSAASTLLVLGTDRGAALVYSHATGVSSRRLEEIVRDRNERHVHGGNSERDRGSGSEEDRGKVSTDDRQTPPGGTEGSRGGPVSSGSDPAGGHDDSGQTPHEH